jgi:hypothetical protein
MDRGDIEGIDKDRKTSRAMAINIKIKIKITRLITNKYND